MKEKNEFLTIKEFCRRSLKSDKTVRRLIKRIKNDGELDSDRVHKEKGRYYLHKDLLKLYVSEFYLWLEENRFIQKNKEPINEYAEYFNQLEWTLWGHISYDKPRHILECHSIMNRYFEKLLNKYPTCHFRLLFVSEKNGGDNGYHNHFALYITEGGLRTQVKKYTDGYFRNLSALTKVEPYIEGLNGVNYLVKEIKQNPDGWDILP